MKKQGFTLAEVLVTLSIIGVVAALTLPALVNNTSNAKIGPALSKFNSTFVNAMDQYLTQSGEESVSTSDINNLQSYIRMERKNGTYTFHPAEGDASYSNYFANSAQLETIGTSVLNIMAAQDAGLSDYNPRYDFNNDGKNDISDYTTTLNMRAGLGAGDNEGNNDANIDDVVDALHSSGVYYQLQDNSLMIVAPIANGVRHADSGQYQKPVAEVIFDINGMTQPNRVGKDVFGFILDESGALIPVGSNVYRQLGYTGSVLIHTTSADQCALGESLSNNWACTGSVADNGWRANF